MFLVKEGREWRKVFVGQHRRRQAEIPRPKESQQAPVGVGGLEDRLTGAQTDGSPWMHSGGLGLLIEQNSDLRIGRAGDTGETARGGSGSMSKKNIFRLPKSRERILNITTLKNMTYRLRNPLFSLI